MSTKHAIMQNGQWCQHGLHHQDVSGETFPIKHGPFPDRASQRHTIPTMINISTCIRNPQCWLSYFSILTQTLQGQIRFGLVYFIGAYYVLATVAGAVSLPFFSHSLSSLVSLAFQEHPQMIPSAHLTSCLYPLAYCEENWRLPYLILEARRTKPLSGQSWEMR